MPSTNSRRSFLRRAASTAAWLPAAAATLSELRSSLAAQPAHGESYWQQIREQFAFEETRVPMNAANLCPTPRVIAERVTQWTRDVDEDCSFDNRAKYVGFLETSRRKVAEHLGVTADEIALVRNTSEANNIINGGLELKAGDEVVLWDQNHPTNNVAWDIRAARYGFTVRRVTIPDDPRDAAQIVDTFAAAFSSRTRVLAVTHVSNVSGVQLPIRALCDAAHSRDVYMHVDGAQTWGALDVSLRDLGCDSYTASAHKWFVGPREVGLLFVKASRVSEIWPHIVAPGWGSDVEPDVRGARKFESLGQRDDAALAAIADTVDFHVAVGPAKVEQRVRQLAQQLKEAARRGGLGLVTPLGPEFSGGVCIVEAAGNARAAAAERLYSEFGIAGAATGGLRLCPHIYNTPEHIERAVRGLLAILG